MSDKYVTSSNTKSIPPSKTSWVDNSDNDNDLPPLPDGWVKNVQQDDNGYPRVKVSLKTIDKTKQETS